MHFIEHIIEPNKLLLAWQSSDEKHRTRYIVAELNRTENERITLTYLVNTDDFRKAQSKGFESYPAFQDTSKTYDNVLDAFMRRLPPRTRGDFTQYLEGLRLKPDVQLSDFALLGYSGAKLPSDGFSIIHPFNNAKGTCELLVEVAGFRHIKKNRDIQININDSATFSKEFNAVTQEEAIQITVNNQHIGYVNRGLVPTFLYWLRAGRITGAWVEKINGVPGKPTAYVYVKISAENKKHGTDSSMEKKFKTVNESELEDFATECRDYGINPNEFELAEHDYTTTTNNPIFFYNAKLTITRNNISRTYPTGNASHWVYDFAMDLRNGIFK